MGKLKGRPLLGVIGSLGVRRDAKAVAALAKLLADADADVAQAAARALGKIGTPEAAKALEAALAGAPAANQVAFCEGLFRCAEALSAEGQAAQSQAIYDRLRSLPQAPQQVRAGALRGAILARQKEGIPLMLEAIRGADYVLTAAAARAAIEMPGPEVTAALAGELPKLPADKQILLVNTLGYRGDASAGPALLALAAKGARRRAPGRRPQPHAPGLRARPAAAGRAVADGRGRPGHRRAGLPGQLPRQGRRRHDPGHARPPGRQGPLPGRRDDRAAERGRVGRQPAEGRRRRRRDRPPGRPQGPARPGRAGRAARPAEHPGQGPLARGVAGGRERARRPLRPPERARQRERRHRQGRVRRPARRARRPT